MRIRKSLCNYVEVTNQWAANSTEGNYYTSIFNTEILQAGAVMGVSIGSKTQFSYWELAKS